MSEALAVATGISKRFGATAALRDVTVEFRSGEVHALVGENGAGKSTLGKVLVGVHLPDSGSVVIDGTATTFSSPAEALRAGFVGVAQELSLIPTMSVVDNVVLGTERFPLVDDKASFDRVRQLIDEHGFDIDPRARVRDLSVADQQKVEILRALSRELRLVVFDEPTARLASHEAMELRRTLRRLADRGVAVVFVSHFLDEVLDVADRVTIMRDGQLVRTSTPSEESHDSLVEAMTGRTSHQLFPDRAYCAADAPTLLEVHDLTVAGQFEAVDLHVRAGEIVGLAGLVGSGRSELAHAIFGATKPASGSVSIAGRRHPGGVVAGLRSGLALIPESRRHQGLIMRRSVADNVALPFIERFRSLFGVSNRRLLESTSDATSRAGVKTASMHSSIDSLSGGNQQKVLFARSLLADPKVLIADEPTRGVDVGAKQSIYALLAELAAEGCAILLISSEIDEVLGLSHRVAVMRSGRLVAQFEGDDMTESNVLSAAFGGNDEPTDQRQEYT